MGKTIAGVLAVLVVLGAGYWFIFMSGQGASGTGTNLGINLGYDQTATTTPQAAAQATTTQAGAPQTTSDNKKIMQATLHTTKGDITIEFDATNAPTASANFIKLAQSGYYDGTKFHRVIKGFMDQGGDPLTKSDATMAQWGTGGPGYSFPDENLNAKNNVGVVSMANSGPNTNGSQFFINAADNNFLDGKYTVFGKVTAGLDVVMAINNTQTGPSDRPVEPIVINSITLK